MDQCATESLAIVFVNVLLFGDGGMAFNLESPAGLGDVLTTPYLINLQCYEIFHKASDVDWWFGETQAVEKWNEMGLRGKLKQGSGQDYTARSFVIFFSSPNIIRMIESSRMRCDKYGRQERCVLGFSRETLRKETTWKI